ncbi:DUF58 domain-containing protein [Leadbettera azotonutricia]|uniref:DUF58 domain-containing protein n=1 Tax=Leadbettera azotonutricia (strain ATCC BAA-888 / DSM 13862 / ZAS-9) TaxID=545695 RepID=F5YE28_LEAAZ|nr:DUF58 domain-containing protein [Leadbettera azotonutricia]AEF81985.1 conserved hypothetical protein [Leadbettera azotonutricia ZAS-9]
MKPGKALFITALLWLFLGAGAFFSDALSLVWLFAGLILLPVIAADALFLYFLVDRLEVKRELPITLAQGANAKARIDIKRGQRPMLPFKITLFDLYPEGMECRDFPAVIDRKLFSTNSTIHFDYTLIPKERGFWFFRGVEILLASPLRFWNLKAFHKCESAGRTYPDFTKIKAAAGVELRGLLEMTGIKNIRRRGQGMEFRNLRDYQEGDSIRDIDWRATSRRRRIDGGAKLIIREYQEEQDQQVLFLLDSGYRLHRREGERMQFDSALEAVLLLSWVSLKHGDSVSVGTFGNVRRWIYPRKGLSTFPRLMNGLCDIFSAPVPSSPFSCLEDALARLKRRTFIILISNFREEDGESLSWILKRIEKRHLLLLVSLREKESETLSARKPLNADEALETAAAFSYLASRKALYQHWEHLGLLTLETSAGGLSSALINRYLQVKRSGKL